jgi:sugar phosphate isomerase/epimerase
MRIGLSSYTWPWAVGREGHIPEKPLDTAALLEKTKKYDISVLQIADNPCLHKMSDAELRMIALLADEYRISLEVGTRGIDPEHLMRYLEIAKLFNSKIVRSMTRSIGEEDFARIREVLPEYEKNDVSIALENHDEHSSGELAAFVDSFKSPFIGVCLDTVNSFAALEPPDKVVKTLSPYALNLHIKDFEVVRFDSELGFSIVGRPAGKGRLNIKWIADYLKEQGKNPNMILELWTPFTGTLNKTIQQEEDWARESIEFLKKLNIQ